MPTCQILRRLNKPFQLTKRITILVKDPGLNAPEYIPYKNSEESKQDCSNIYAIKKENYQKRVKDFISTTFLIL